MFLGSDKRYFLSFGGGLYIVNDRKYNDQAYCLSDQFIHPNNYGGVRQDGKRLLIAGGETKEFKAIQVDIYGII